MAEETYTVEVPVEDHVVEEVAPDNLEDAIRIVIRRAQEVNGLVCGLSEIARQLDRRTVRLCILAEDCEDAEYKKLILGLASQGNIDIVQVEEREKLAQWAGLVRRGADGEVRKTLKCSSVAIRDFGPRTKALEYLLSHLQSS